MSVVKGSTVVGQNDAAYRRGLPDSRLRGPIEDGVVGNRQALPPPPPPPPPSVADRRFQDYYYDSDVDENDLNSLQYPTTNFDVVDEAQEPIVRSKPQPRPPKLSPKYPPRNGPVIPGLVSYEEYEYDRSCSYPGCRCRTFSRIYV